MKALSVRQPYAYLIACGDKTIELRSRPTKYRGKLLICSSKSGAVTWVLKNDKYYLAPAGVTMAIVDLVDCRLAEYDDAEEAYSEPQDVIGYYAWVLENAQEVKPNKVFGKLNFFEVDDSLIEPCGDNDYFSFLETGTPKFERDAIIEAVS